jgi:replicative DNA helicase
VASEEETPLAYQVFGLAFQEPGAIGYFSENLPTLAVGAAEGQCGLSQFYKALLSFYEKTGLDPVNPIAFKSWLQSETDIYEALGGYEMVNLFVETMTKLELSEPRAVTSVLRTRANKRQQLDFVQELQGLLNRKSKADDDTTSRIQFLADKIRELENDLDYDPLVRVVTANDIANRAETLWDIPEFMSTPFKALNRAMGYTDGGGFFKGAVHSIIAQSGKGKSTFTKCLCNHWADQGHTVLFINFEEPAALWERTLLIQLTGHNMWLGSGSDTQKEEMTRIFQNKLRKWGDKFMVRHDPDTPYFDDLEQWVRDLAGHVTPDVVVIDTLQSMFTKGNKAARWGQFEEMMVRLEKLARDMNSVFIITVQENANRMREGREVVQQSDTGGSITIQQKSAVTIFLVERRSTTGDDSIDGTIMELQIPKNRITGVTFSKAPALVKYVDESKSYIAYDPVEDNDYPAFGMQVLEDLLDDSY